MATKTLDRPVPATPGTRPASRTSPKRERISFAEYMERERSSDVKHDLVDGIMVPVWPTVDEEGNELAGASTEHNTICGNLIIALGNALDDTGCRVLTSDQKVYIRERLSYYPDVTVACGDLMVTIGEALQNPVLIVEVLSPPMALKDRDTKFRDYRAIGSLRHYVLIDQYEPRLEHYERSPGEHWVLARELNALADEWRFDLNGTQVAISLAKVYRLVSFPPADPDEEIETE